MKTTKQKAIVFCAGILICLLILEVALRVVGSIYADISESDTGKNKKGTTTILCIGDSFTFGIGAPRDLSYPAQLEKLLNQAAPGVKYSVINRGWPGQNSTQFLKRFEDYLKEFKPDIVTILIGAQNLGNYFGYQDFLRKAQKQERSFLQELHGSLDRIRIYKFIRLLFQTPQPNWSGDEFTNEQKPARILNPEKKKQHRVPECMTGLELKEQGEYDKALETLLGAAKTKNLGAECSNIVGSIYRERLQFDQAIDWFKKGIEYDPTQFKNYEDIGLSYFARNRMEEAIDWIKKGFDNARVETLHPRCYSLIGRAFETLGNSEKALGFFAKERQKKKERNDFLRGLAGDYFLLFQKSSKNIEVYSWIRADVEQMLSLVIQYNALPVLMNYPYMPEIDHVYRKLAEDRQVPYVDHQKAFENFTQNGMLSSEYFIPDGHPNAKGYRIMADNILKILKESQLITQ